MMLATSNNMLCVLLTMLLGTGAMPMVPSTSWGMLEKGSLENLRGRVCRANGTCIPTNGTTCMGVKVPYSHTSDDIAGMSRHQIAYYLENLAGLYRVPKCWAAIQPFVCALFVPRCDPDTSSIVLPTHEMCKVAQTQCRILNDTLQSLIPFFNCEDTLRYPTDCKSETRDIIRFNTTAQCVSPLVPTDDPASFYDGIEGCGLRCADPMLTDQESQQIHTMVAWAATLTLICNLFAVASFVVDWRSTSNYPSLIVFYINFCFLISNFGWLAQFIPGAREDVVCRKDGTLRLSEPSGGENLSCVIVFVMVYYFLIAACVWFVIFSYAWYLWVKSLGKISVRFEKKAAYFHLVAWSLPLILTISTMATSQIDGNSVAGICFVGYYSLSARLLLLILPVLCLAMVGAFFLTRVLTTLISVQIGSHQIISDKYNREIRCNILRVALCLVGCAVTVLTSIICHVYHAQNDPVWKRSLRKYLICRVNPLESECKMGARPSVAMIQLHLLVLFLAGVMMSSWVWRSSTIDIWKVALGRMFSKKERKRAVMKKHKMIAQAYSKRREINDNGRLSISINETRDPAGLNFDLNSAESRDFSSTWAAALPKLVTRRGALIYATTDSNHSNQSHRRRNSYDSEISYSVRRVSVESRRHSLDSQISVRIEELTTKAKMSGAPRRYKGAKGSRSRRRDHHIGRRYRRTSSTSQDSQMGIQLLTALAMGNSSMFPNGRRHANAGLGAYGLPPGVPMIGAPVSDDDWVNEDHQDVIITPYNDGSHSEGPSSRTMSKSKAIKAAESDSENVVARKPRSNSSRRTRKESFSSGRRKHRDSGHYDVRRAVKKKSKKCDDREVTRSKDSGSSRKKVHSEGDNKGKYTVCKTDDFSDEDGSDWKASESESEAERLEGKRHSRRSEANKSKRSVDVATQVSMEEMGTQTEPDVSATANQSTQMTPPFHIRLINKTLNSNGHVSVPTPRYNQLWAAAQESKAS